MVDLVIANGENAAGGFGITEETARDLYRCGVHLLTSGNHIWKHKEIHAYLEDTDRLLRPANYPPESPGRGYAIVETAAGDVTVAPADVARGTVEVELSRIETPEEDA